MKPFLFLLLTPLLTAMIHSFGPAISIDPGVAVGSLQVNGKNITLRHAYAHLHDNAEGLLDRPKELRVLLTDREVPPNALAGIVFLPVVDLAKQGRVQGLLFEMAPDDPNEVVMTLLYPPSETGQFVIRQSLSVTGEQLFKDWSLTSQRVVGAIERRDEQTSNRPEFPAISYSIRFSAPVFNEPPVTADLKGKAALDSPQLRVLSAKAAALTKGDFAALRSLSTERANRRSEAMLAQRGAEVTRLARQGGAEVGKIIPKVQRMVERGDRAVAIFPGKQWFTFVREGGEWKSDD
ncbi:MAG: hypothetical protein ACREAB_11585 [Blastocatellia bacterium]